MILTIKTDQPDAELAIYEKSGIKLTSNSWRAHRELEVTILSEIENLLNDLDANYGLLTGVVIFAGPGSFTGLRIGFAVSNTLAASLNIPNTKSAGEDWAITGIEKLTSLSGPQILLPDYGGEANITQPRK
jgi:tRNA threonylcarbamoyladenosine biosynthesis protein TsaB